ncbi:ParB/RepB/Spo0J family partition protein [Allorhizobium pseudoryzae]|uniref:ParB/RepB/Spo0J family partition protein n=1 Tax=Allorhizobium pseudoryzae TaxID=379684 RepID=UPI003D0098D9
MTVLSMIKASADTAPANVPSISQISTGLIDIPAHHRKHSSVAIEAMAENITLHGLMQPIEIVHRADVSGRYWLIFGALRLKAVLHNGWTTINAVVRQGDDVASDTARRLRSIHENMARASLNSLSRAVAIADWCETYRAVQYRVKPGPKASSETADGPSLNFRLAVDDAVLLEASAQFTASFSEAAQSFFAISRAAVFRAIKIASIPYLERERIELHPLADSEGELYQLGGIKEAERQTAVIDLILSGKAGTVEDAISLLDGRPKLVRETWEKMAEQFGRLKELQQDRFFDLNEASISRWQAKRGAK